MKLRWLLMGAGVLFFIPRTRSWMLQAISKIIDAQTDSDTGSVEKKE
jgi:hypothetical protein